MIFSDSTSVRIWSMSMLRMCWHNELTRNVHWRNCRRWHSLCLHRRQFQCVESFRKNDSLYRKSAMCNLLSESRSAGWFSWFRFNFHWKKYFRNYGQNKFYYWEKIRMFLLANNFQWRCIRKLLPDAFFFYKCWFKKYLMFWFKKKADQGNVHSGSGILENVREPVGPFWSIFVWNNNSFTCDR